MAGDYPDIPYVQAAGDGGPRTQTQLAVIHATDNTASDTAEASYASHRPDQISAHFYSDEDSVTQGLRLSRIAYGCYPIGNGRSVQFELCGLSNRLSDATLQRIAPIVRRVCDKYGIPIRHVSPAEMRAGAKGICGHGDVTAAWGQGDHTDPGPTFPWVKFIGYVNTVPASLEEDDMNQWEHDRLSGAFDASVRIEAALIAIAAKVDIDPTELEAIKAAAAAGAAAAFNAGVPVLVDAIVAKLPAGAMTRDDVEAAVRDAFAGGLAPEK